jgi:predicted metal-dependent hydrolase
METIVSSSIQGFQGPMSKEMLQELQNVVEANDNETPKQIARRIGVDVETLVALNKDRYEGLEANAHLIEGTVLQLPSKENETNTQNDAALEDFVKDIEDQEVAKRVREVASEPSKLVHVLKTKDYVQWDVRTRISLLKWLKEEVMKLNSFREYVNEIDEESEDEYISDSDSDIVEKRALLRAAHDLGRDRDGNRYWCFASPSDPVRGVRARSARILIISPKYYECHIITHYTLENDQCRFYYSLKS